VKLSKTGTVLASINAFLILLITCLEFWHRAKTGSQSGGWLFLYPFLWNLPVSLLLIPLVGLRLPEAISISLLIIFGSVQWYFIGFAFERVIRKFQNDGRTQKLRSKKVL